MSTPVLQFIVPSRPSSCSSPVIRKSACSAVSTAWPPHRNPLAVVLGGAPETCTPGHYNQEGRPADDRRDNRLEGYVHGSAAYWNKLEDWRNDGPLEGLEVIETTR